MYGFISANRAWHVGTTFTVYPVEEFDESGSLAERHYPAKGCKWYCELAQNNRVGGDVLEWREAENTGQLKTTRDNSVWNVARQNGDVWIVASEE